jgi:hypothetical protein
MNINYLSNFVGWLRNPYDSNKVLFLKPTKSKQTEKTVNLYISAVTNFYDYLFRSQELSKKSLKK